MQRRSPSRAEEWRHALSRRYLASEHCRGRYTQQSRDHHVAVLDLLAWFEGEKVRHSVLKEHFVVRRESTDRRLRVVAETVIPGKPMAQRPPPPEKRMYVHQLSVILCGLVEAGFVERCEERPPTMHGQERQRPQVFYKVAAGQMRELWCPGLGPAMAEDRGPGPQDLPFWEAVREKLREIDLDPSGVDDATFRAAMEEIAWAITGPGRMLPAAKSDGRPGKNAAKDEGR